MSSALRTTWTLVAGWMLVLGTGGWLTGVTVGGLLTSREAVRAYPKGPGKALERLENRPDGTIPLVLRAMEDARADLAEGQPLTAAGILAAYEKLYDSSGIKNNQQGLPPPTMERFRETLWKMSRDGLIRRVGRRGYKFTPDGRELLARGREEDG